MERESEELRSCREHAASWRRTAERQAGELVAALKQRDRAREFVQRTGLRVLVVAEERDAARAGLAEANTTIDRMGQEWNAHCVVNARLQGEAQRARAELTETQRLLGTALSDVKRLQEGGHTACADQARWRAVSEAARVIDAEHRGVGSMCDDDLEQAMVRALRSSPRLVRERDTARDELALALKQRNREEEAAMHSGGLLSDVCDALWGDEHRAEVHGYDGVVERAKEAVRLLGRVEWGRAGGTPTCHFCVSTYSTETGPLHADGCEIAAFLDGGEVSNG